MRVYLRWGMMSVFAVSAATVWAQKDSASVFKRTHQLQEVVVRGGGARRVNNSAFNVLAVDTRQLRNTTLNLSGVLDRLAGVKIRQEGGLGSAMNINLGGFTGKHVRVFIDGVPMEGASSSFGLNNIPVSMASRLEIYKGVVPIELGGDALGGAINIVTDHSPNTYIDAGYSYGSWNTHRANVSLGWTNKNGFTLRLNAYRNQSDNNYKVLTQWTDIQTNAVSEEEGWFRRFHDRYHNEAVSLQGGITDKSWADKLLVGVTWSHEHADIQNANLMKIVFGGKYRTAEGITPNMLYEKRNLIVPNLNLRIALRYDISTTNNVDTLSRTYSWTGQYRTNSYQGEGVATLSEFRGKTFSAVSMLKYTLGEHHFLTLNNTYINYHRRTTNNAANAVQQTAATFMRRVNNKNILGASYKFIPSTRWNAELFAKYYSTHVLGPVNVAESGAARYEEQKRNKQALGYGVAGTYLPWTRHWQFKASYEKTYRLPTDRELFGDGDYEESNATLRPESSNNFNVNAVWDGRFSHIHILHADLGVGYRDISDYIIRTIGQKGTAVSTNHGKVRGWTLDFTARYYYKDVFSLGGNISLQDLRDREKFNSIGAESVTEGNRVPNQPYTFGNIDAGYTFHRFLGKQNDLTVAWNTRYIHRFYRTWAGYGAKLYIPTQTSHDMNATYSMAGGRYNVSIEASNLTDALLYDNYSLQKPGRGFAVKFRYMFYKRK